MEISKADGKSCRWLFQLVYENSTIPLAPEFPVAVPETVLFSDKSPELGVPVKWMRSDEEGKIERLDFPIEARKAIEKLEHVERSFLSNKRADTEWFCRAWPVSPFDYKIGSENATWRMYVARCIVHERRQELLHFLEKMKAEEAKLLEEEYWRVNVFARYKRALRNKLRSSKKKKAEDAEASEMNREAIPRWYRHEMPSAAPKDDGEGDDDSEYEYYGEDYDGEDDNFSDISSGEDEG